MRARLSILVVLSVAACSDDALDGNSSGSGSSTGAATTGTSGPMDGAIGTDATRGEVDGGSSSSSGSGVGTETGTTAGSGGSSSSGEAGTTSTGPESTSSVVPGSTSTGDGETTGDATTGGVAECDPTNPGGDMACSDGVVVAGELCYETQPPLVAAGTFATRVWAGDVDGDADPDALVLVEYPAALSVLLNDGTGGLVPSSTYDLAGAANVGTRDVAGADVNGDGWVDAVVAFASPHSLRVLLNGGGGAYGLPVVTMLPQAPLGVALGDVDGDLFVDAVVSDAAGVTVHYGLGNGSFGMSATQADPALVQGREPVLHDLDDDGDLDVAVAFVGAAGVLLNEAGMLGTPTGFPVAGGPDDVAVGDVTGDDVPDVVLADGFNNDVYVLPGVGDGTLAPSLPPLVGRYVVVGDANADCSDDVLTRTAPLMLDDLTIYASDGMGGLAAPQAFLLHSGMVDMDGADFDGDGLTDVLFAIGPLGEAGVALTEP